MPQKKAITEAIEMMQNFKAHCKQNNIPCASFIVEHKDKNDYEIHIKVYGDKDLVLDGMEQTMDALADCSAPFAQS